MNSNNKSETAYKTIGEVTKELGLINKKLVAYKHILLDIGKLNLSKLNQ